jgi:hypothetical protein
MSNAVIQERLEDINFGTRTGSLWLSCTFREMPIIVLRIAAIYIVGKVASRKIIYARANRLVGDGDEPKTGQ